MEQVFESRRNRVRLVESCGEKRVRKEFAHWQQWKQEYERYCFLADSQIRLPKLWEAGEGYLELSYVEGSTLLEILEEQERQGRGFHEPWKALADWLLCFYEKTGFLMEDLNLRNFIYASSENCLYEIDFEGEIQRDAARGAGILLAYIRLYDPPETSIKEEICELLIQRLSRGWELADKILWQQMEEESGKLAERRRKRTAAGSKIRRKFP